MLFNSFDFIFLFLPIVFAGFYFIGRRNQLAAAAWLTVASLCFYGWLSIKVLPLLLISIGVNYWFGGVLSNASQTKKGKLYLYGAVSSNLALLGYFKYAGLFVSSVNIGLQKAGVPTLTVPHIILPIGISFYTFTQIAFLVDCWQGKVRERRLLHYALFVTYFPHLIAGPILHHSQMMPQFAKSSTYRIDYDKLIVGLVIFTVGLIKKTLIADPLSEYADLVFSIADNGAPALSFYLAWAGVLSYTFQIYFDFSGYTDMAIGISLLFGINIPINFNSPYRATSIIEFWRRWHISLSAFLREYLYIPLGGNQNGKFKRYLNLLITMLLGGLWHGASWNFLFWGGLHGCYLCINHVWKKCFPTSDRWGRAYQSLSWLITFLSVCFAWVLFRASTFDGAKRIYAAMVGLTDHNSEALLATLRALHADQVASLAAIFYEGKILEMGGVPAHIDNIEILGFSIAWIYSTIIGFLVANHLDGLQYLLAAMVVALIPFNSNRLAASLNPEHHSVEKTYIFLCLAAALYYLISCIWVMNKHQVFIYFQF